MKDAKDPGTMELLAPEPYLVVMNTKKGYREFCTSTLCKWCRVRWSNKFKYANTWELEKLPELLEFAFTRRCVTVGVVIGNEITVLGQSKYPVPA